MFLRYINTLCMWFWEVRFMFALIPYFCLWVSVVWHSCSMWVIVNGWLLQWVQVDGVAFLILCSCDSLVWPVHKSVIIIPSFLVLKFDVCWWKSWILLCNWVLLVVFHVSFHSFFATLLQWIIWSSQGIGRWLRLLVSEGTVASFAAASAFSFPSIPWRAGKQMTVAFVLVVFSSWMGDISWFSWSNDFVRDFVTLMESAYMMIWVSLFECAYLIASRMA